MNERVSEMLGTIEHYRRQARETLELPDGRVVKFLATCRPDGSKSFLHIPMTSMSRAPLELERDYGFQGIAGHYRLPDGLSAENLQLYAHVMLHAEAAGDITLDAYNEKTGGVRRMLEALNPELRSLDTAASEPIWGQYDVLLGVASDYRVEDIQFYLDRDSGRAARQDPQWRGLKEKIEMRLPLRWVPSPETLKSIDTQLGLARKPGAAPEQPAVNAFARNMKFI